jgi:hypothetical protein
MSCEDCNCGKKEQEIMEEYKHFCKKHNSLSLNSCVLCEAEAHENSKEEHNNSLNRKNKPVFSGVLQYFPDAIMEISTHSKKGNDKHNPGQPLHWSKEKSKDHADCIARHLIDIGPNWDEIDPESQSYHATALAWRSLALLQTLLERNKLNADKT